MRARVDDEPLDEAGRARDHEVGEDRRVGHRDALDARVRDVALVPERDVLERRPARTRAAARARPHEVLAEDRVPLVGHRRASPSGPRRSPPRPRRPRCAASGARRARCCSIAVPSSASAVKHLGVAVARDDLGGDGLRARGRARRARASRSAGSRLPYTPTAPAILPTAIAWRAAMSRPAARTISACQRANTSPAVIGSAWIPCERPIIGVSRVLARALGERGREPHHAGDDPLERAAAVWIASAGVEHVRRGHPEVEPARGLTGELLDVRQERDDVVTCGRLDLEDPRGSSLPAAAARMLFRTAHRHRARVFHRPADGQLDFEPELESILVFPESCELGPTVTRDHRTGLRIPHTRDPKIGASSRDVGEARAGLSADLRRLQEHGGVDR